jgi:hypothetical protein
MSLLMVALAISALCSLAGIALSGRDEGDAVS